MSANIKEGVAIHFFSQGAGSAHSVPSLYIWRHVTVRSVPGHLKRLTTYTVYVSCGGMAAADILSLYSDLRMWI